MPDDTLEFQLNDAIRRIKIAISQASATELVDIAGDITRHAAALRIEKAKATSEMVDQEHGRRWQAEVPNVCDRTYSMRLLSRLQRDNETTIELITRLLESGVIVMEWKYKKLIALARSQRVAITISPDPILPDDAEHDIGERWHDGYPSFNWIGDGT